MIAGQFSCLVLTYNEENNISRLLESLFWSPEILILDSGSTDNTLNLVSSFPNTRVLFREFDTFAKQCNYGLSQLTSRWILSLDADYIVTNRLRLEIQSILRADNEDRHSCNDAYRISFIFCINGRSIRSGLMPPRISFYKKDLARYIDIGHAHKVVIQGKVGQLSGRLYHDDRKSFNRWINSQAKYQSIEAEMLRVTDLKDLSLPDRLRKRTFMTPFIAFFVCLILRGGMLDGKEGIIYAFQRLVAESLLFLAMNFEEK